LCERELGEGFFEALCEVLYFGLVVFEFVDECLVFCGFGLEVGVVCVDKVLLFLVIGFECGEFVVLLGEFGGGVVEVVGDFEVFFFELG